MNLFACCWSRQKDVLPTLPSVPVEVVRDDPRSWSSVKCDISGVSQPKQPAMTSVSGEVLREEPRSRSSVESDISDVSQPKQPAMSSVPGEVLRDFLLPLNRWTLDDVQFTCPRFLRLITVRMSSVCLRQIEIATFDANNTSYTTEPVGGRYYIGVYGTPGRYIRKRHVDIALLFSEFLQALWSSRVNQMRLGGLVFTPELAALVLQAPIVADYLSVWGCSCTELTSTLFRKVLLHVSPTSLCLARCDLRASQISDEFIRTLSKNRVLRTSIYPLEGDDVCVTDDTIVEFYARQDVQIDQEREQLEALTLYDGTFTKGLFKRLVEASSVSMRTRPLKIRVYPLRFEDEDLLDYAQHLSYYLRGHPHQLRIYDFSGEQHGAVAAMRLQIMLRSNSLVLIRARPDSGLFQESDE